jgi:hypothetical protein
MRKSDRRYLHRAVGHPLVQDIPHVLSDARLSADAKIVYLALLRSANASLIFLTLPFLSARRVEKSLQATGHLTDLLD